MATELNKRDIINLIEFTSDAQFHNQMLVRNCDDEMKESGSIKRKLRFIKRQGELIDKLKLVLAEMRESGAE